MIRSNEEILELRAKKLAAARPPESLVRGDRPEDRYLIVACGAERFAVALTSIAEMFRPSSVTPLPKAPLPLWGLTSWRGSILPVVVAGRCRPSQGAGVMVVMAVDHRIVAGLWADDVEGEVAIQPEQIHVTEGVHGTGDTTFAGVTTDAATIFDVAGLTRLLDAGSHGDDRRAVDNTTREKS
ncbi:MAG: chemotaxis protein CheW [Gemmatimonadaceae bacterium]